jgi:hypothetical protein
MPGLWPTCHDFLCLASNTFRTIELFTIIGTRRAAIWPYPLPTSKQVQERRKPLPGFRF